MTRGVVITNISNWENEDWVIIEEKDVSPGALTTADMPRRTRIAPGESVTIHKQNSFPLRIVPVENEEAEARHVDHDGWDVEAKARRELSEKSPG